MILDEVQVEALLVPYLVLNERRAPGDAEEMASEVSFKTDELKEAALRYASQRRGR